MKELYYTSKILGIYKGIRLFPLGMKLIIQPYNRRFTLAAFSGLSSVVTVWWLYLIYIFSPYFEIKNSR